MVVDVFSFETPQLPSSTALAMLLGLGLAICDSRFLVLLQV